jgi:glycosyltransferase involved in cell wall biosynthesis
MPGSVDYAVTVIIPTLALARRAQLLRRAVESVHAQQGVRAVPLVVLNGGAQDAQLVEHLRQDKRVRVVATAAADLPGAFSVGRAHVDTPFFAALDDDDVLLPGGLHVRATALVGRPDCVAAVSNGWRRDARGDTLHVQCFDPIRDDPLRSILRFNWLLPGAWLGRTEAFKEEVFERMPRYLELTYLGVRLATTHRTCFIDEPTVAWSADTPWSESKSREYVFGQELALLRILELDLPADVLRGFRRKLAWARHSAALLHLEVGDSRQAWKAHLRSLRSRHALNFLRLTPRLLLNTTPLGASG